MPAPAESNAPCAGVDSTASAEIVALAKALIAEDDMWFMDRSRCLNKGFHAHGSLSALSIMHYGRSRCVLRNRGRERRRREGEQSGKLVLGLRLVKEFQAQVHRRCVHYAMRGPATSVTPTIMLV